MLDRLGQLLRDVAAAAAGGAARAGHDATPRGPEAWARALVATPSRAPEAAQALAPTELPDVLARLDRAAHGSAARALATHALAARAPASFGDGTLHAIARALSPTARQAVLAALPAPQAAALEARGFAIGEQASVERASERRDRARLEAKSPWARSPGLAALHRELDLDVRVAALRRGEPAIGADERMGVEEQLGRLDAAERKQLREALVERPPHPRLREMRHHRALQGAPTAQGLLEILSGAPLGLEPSPSAELRRRASEALEAYLPASTPDDRARWLAALERSDAATTLVERQGLAALRAISDLGIRVVEDAGHAWVEGKTLVDLHAAAPERADELRRLHATRGREGLRDALAAIGAHRFGNSATVDRALRAAGLEATVDLCRALEGDAHGARALRHFHGDGATFDRLLGRTLAEQRRTLAEAGARVAGWGSGGVPMLRGGAWPAERAETPLHRAARAEAMTRAGLPTALATRAPAELSLAELGDRSRAGKRELARRDPAAAARLERELAGRRFVNFEKYDRLYAQDVENPEHLYSVRTFDAWRAADAHVRQAAAASRGRPLREGELLEVMRAAHRLAGQGVVDVHESHLKTEDLGRLRATDVDHVQLGGALTSMPKAVAELLDRNPYLAGEQLRFPSEGDTVTRSVVFAKGRDVPRFVAETEAWVRANEGRLPPERLAAELHWRLVSIHPFMDGNGRTAKLMADFIVERAGGEPLVWRAGDVMKNVERWPAEARCAAEAELAVVERHLDAAVDAPASAPGPGPARLAPPTPKPKPTPGSEPQPMSAPKPISAARPAPRPRVSSGPPESTP